MNPWDMLKNIARPKNEPLAGVSPALREILTILAGIPWSTRSVPRTKLVEEPLKKLRAAPPEERLAFIFEALSAMESGQTLSQNYGMANLLRAGAPLNSLDAVVVVRGSPFRLEEALFSHAVQSGVE